MVRRFAFQQAHHNFYRGPVRPAELAWPPASKGRARTLSAAELVRHLLPAPTARAWRTPVKLWRRRASLGHPGLGGQRPDRRAAWQPAQRLEPRLGRERV